MWLPSFLTFPINFPTIPSISLPANIQRRFLSYVLKRALGRFVIAGGLDVERIQAQIGQGWVEIEQLDVNADEINTLIPSSLPFTVTSGNVSKVSARVPFPNLWSDPLSLTVDTLQLELAFATPKGRASETQDTALKLKSKGLPLHQDLAASFTSAADDFLHDELDAFEGAELDRSIRESFISTQTDPFAHEDDPPGSFPGFFQTASSDTSSTESPSLPHEVESTTVLAGLVERILTRLECRVKDIRVRIRYEDDERGGIFELRIGEVRYADETPVEPAPGERKTVRAIRLSKVAVYLLPIPEPETIKINPSLIRSPSAIRSLSISSSSSSSTSSDSSDGDYHDMVMSQAVADLRQSTYGGLGQSTMTAASGTSIYQSAISENVIVEETRQAISQTLPQESPSRVDSRETSRSATPTAASRPETQETLLLSFGSDDIVVRMTTKQTFSIPSSTPLSSSTSESPHINPNASDVPFSTLPEVAVDLYFGTFSSIIFPSQAALILAAAHAALDASPSTPTTTDTPVQAEKQIVQPRFEALVRVKAVCIAVVYDLNEPSADFHGSLTQFWSRPLSMYLPIGHVRLRLEEITASYMISGSMRRASTREGNRNTSIGLSIKSGTRFIPSPRQTVLSFSIADASLFEYLASAVGREDDDGPPGGSFPVLIFDPNLERQYDIPAGVASSVLSTQNRKPSALPEFPDFEVIDWRNAGAQLRGGEKSWRVRPRGRGILRGAVGHADSTTGPVVYVQNGASEGKPAVITILPVHVFLDLSFVERLLPFLRSLTPVMKSRNTTPATALTSISRTTKSMHVKPAYAGSNGDRKSSLRVPPPCTPRPLLAISCALIRLDIRCPAPPARRGSWGDDAHLRSGIVTLDIHGLKTCISENPLPGPLSLSRRPSGNNYNSDDGGVDIEWKAVVLSFCRAPKKRSSVFLVVGPLAPDPDDDEGILLPAVNIQSQVSSITGIKTQVISCKIPSMQGKILQGTVEGLQFFADDMTHWLDGAFGDGSAPKPRDDLRMIGSRFFGSKASSSVSSSAIEDEDEVSSATSLRVAISEAEIMLLVPKGAQAPGDSEVKNRNLSLHASDLDIKLESNASAGKQETTLVLSAMDADFYDRANVREDARQLFGRTTPLTLTTHSQPIVLVRFSSLTRADQTKETGIRITANACTVFVTKDLDWVRDLTRFATTPEGVFEDVVPSEVTRIQIALYDCSVHLAAPTIPGAIVVVANMVDIRTVMQSYADDNTIEIGATAINVLAIDDLSTISPLPMGFAMSLEAWRHAGYAPLIELATFDGKLNRILGSDREVQMDVTQARIKVTACADSFATFGALAGDLSNLAPAKASPKTPPKPQMSLDKSIDVFASVDFEAFGQAPDIVSEADMIEDDLPTNLDYLDRAARQSLAGGPSFDPSTGESLRSWESTDDDSRAIFEGNGETAKTLFAEQVEDDATYWDKLPALKNADETKFGEMRIRLQDCTISLYLHDGYDWHRTRKAIEDEIKAVRRRLERIRQLLASGQKADASIEHASSMLFNSVYIGLDENRDEMDSAALIAAIDEELDDLAAADSATQSSWQSFPEAGTAGGRTTAVATKKTHVRLRGKRLTRSKRPQMEFALGGIRAEIDMYGAKDATASRIHIQAKAFEILDHIKTSTWKKFLTEMKSDARGNVRETDADMIRLEIINVRPSLPSTDEEIRVRAKILPLRLHVDQDALDFLKRFFSFSVPGTKASVAAPKIEPFFQHVEIFPVELKLDYKPKRVDYAALRQGHTIELMNFFHFDGAEMTLRHVTLSGITGTTRLSSMLQDIWTPDVKANQLADVISGVAPIRSLVNVGSGVADLILLPIEQYRKDGRLARGVQRGTNSFVRSTALEVMKLGARLATGTQVVLEHAEGVLGGHVPEGVVLEAASPHDSSSEDEGEKVQSRYANQPGDVREGVKAAYKSLSSNLNSAAQTILAVPMEVYERSGTDGPLKAVVRAVPIAVLKPMIGASEAVSKTLWGLRNSLDPDNVREMGDKYK